MFLFSPGHVPLIPDGLHYTDDANDEVSTVTVCLAMTVGWHLLGTIVVVA